MKKLRINLPSEGFGTTATLLEDEAPKTCEGIWRVLPIKAKLLHATSSGNETLIELEGENKPRFDPENWVFNVIPGDILFWHSLWGDGKYLKDRRDNSEITFIYGRHVKLRDLSLRETGANLFAAFDSKLDEFAKICKRIRFDGAKEIMIERVPN